MIRHTMWNPPDWSKVEVSPGFWLLLAGLFWLDEGTGLLPWGLLACLIHELGHIGAASACSGKIQRLSLTMVGAELSISYETPPSYGKDTLIALAGPAANLVTGGLSLAFGQQLPGVLSLGIGAFNLLPIQPLDGGRVLYALLADRLDPDWADRLMTAAAGCLVGGLVGIGTIVAVHYANVTLLFTALWLLTGVLRHGGRENGDGGAGVRRHQKRER